jgi:hypothetical protein
VRNWLLISIVWLCHNNVNAQSPLANEWLLGGQKQLIKFQTEPPKISFVGDSSKPYYFIFKGVSSICDTNGKFIFVTDAYRVFDRNGDTMPGGGGALNNKQYIFRRGHAPVPFNSIILPKNATQYYIVYPTISDSAIEHWWNIATYIFRFDELRYTLVDMSANNGNGAVVELNQLIKFLPEDLGFSASFNQCNLTATRHANGRDWWLIKPSVDHRNIKYKFLFTPNGIVEYPSQFIQQNLGTKTNFNYVGQSCFSQDGEWYAECNMNTPVTIYKFDRCSGILTLNRKIWPSSNNNSIFEGLCFSPNNKYLYACDEYNIYQIDMAEPLDSLASVLVSEPDTSANFPQYSGMQLTPTGHIWVGSWHGVSKDINAIMQPNLKGKACGFKFDYARLLSNTNEPPNILNYGLGALKGSPCDTILPPIIITVPAAWLLYPNPAYNSVKLKIPNSIVGNSISICMFNMLGQQLLQGAFNIDAHYEITIPTSNLANGVYVLKTNNGNSKFVGRFLKE